jgi:branched-chain amino acid transport system permease protein
MDYALTLLIFIGLYVMLASSFNLIIGYGGLISIAHPIFFAIGAYGSALLARDAGMPILLAIACGTLMAALASVALSLPSLRVSGDYLLIASIGFQLGLLQVIENLEFTGGPGGLSNIPALFNDKLRNIWFTPIALGAAVLTVWVVRAIVKSEYGRAIRAMRDDELAFSALGRNAMRIKVVIFAVGSAFAGLAGALYAHHFQYLTPEKFQILESGAILTMVVVGGMATTWGPVVGAVLLTLLPQLIGFLNLSSSLMGPIQGMLYTGLVLVFMFARPAGLVGKT